MAIQFPGHEVTYAYGYLANAYGISGNEPINRPILTDQKHTVLEALEFVRSVCRKLSLSVTLMHFERATDAVQNARTYGECQGPINELRLRMHDELKSRTFLYVPPEDAKYFNQKEPFGQRVTLKFPKAIGDIESAGDCLAMSMPTAAVFHLMRVLERGVQSFGKRLGVKLTGEKNWHNILDELNKEIKALPDSPPKAKRRKAEFAAVSANLFNVKLAWRNPVMHPKESYTQSQGCEIYESTHSFMENLASVI